MQKKILKNQKSELNYIININKDIEIYNNNVKYLEKKIKEKNELNDEINLLIEEENQLTT